jgi:hypothetical protein
VADRTVADLVAEHLALAEAERIDLCRELEADLQATRELAHEAIHLAARLTTQNQRQAQIIEHLREELRRYTAAQIGKAA